MSSEALAQLLNANATIAPMTIFSVLFLILSIKGIGVDFSPIIIPLHNDSSSN